MVDTQQPRQARSGAAAGGSANAGGDTHGRGYEGDANGATGSANGGGGGKGKSDPASGGTQKSQDAEDALLTAVIRGAAGNPPDGDGRNVTPPADVSGKVLSAADFTDDKTGLPRYAGAVQSVQSALVYARADDPSNYGSSAGIITGDSL